jgi:hypothetical protein
VGLSGVPAGEAEKQWIQSFPPALPLSVHPFVPDLFLGFLLRIHPEMPGASGWRSGIEGSVQGVFQSVAGSANLD